MSQRLQSVIYLPVSWLSPISMFTIIHFCLNLIIYFFLLFAKNEPLQKVQVLSVNELWKNKSSPPKSSLFFQANSVSWLQCPFTEHYQRLPLSWSSSLSLSPPSSKYSLWLPTAPDNENTYKYYPRLCEIFFKYLLSKHIDVPEQCTGMCVQNYEDKNTQKVSQFFWRTFSLFSM